MNSKREVKEEDLKEIRNQIDRLEIEIQMYRDKLDAYENGDVELQTVVDWIDNTEILYRL